MANPTTPTNAEESKVFADINTQSITNEGMLTTKTFETKSSYVTGSETIGGDLVVKGGISVKGKILPDTNSGTATVLGNNLKLVNSNNQVLIQTDATGNMAISKGLSVGGASIFPKDTIITSCEFEEKYRNTTKKTTQGLISSDNIRFAKRLICNDSKFKIDIDSREIVADTFTQTLEELFSEEATIQKGVFNTSLESNKTTLLKGNTSISFASIEKAEIDTANVENLSVANLATTGSICTKDLQCAGSIRTDGGVTINGNGIEGGALVVNGGRVIANNGISVWTDNVRFQAMHIIGVGVSAEEEKDAPPVFTVQEGLKSYFGGDVTFSDANVVLQNSKLFSDLIYIANLDSDTDKGLIFTSNANGWENYKAQSLVYYGEEEEEQNAEGDLDYLFENADSIELAAITRHGGDAKDIAKIKSRLEARKLAAKKVADQARNVIRPKHFSIASDASYRFDSNGGALVRELVAQDGIFDTIKAYSFTTANFEVQNLAVNSVSAADGIVTNSLKNTGSTELGGNVYFSNSVVSVEADTSVDLYAGSTIKGTTEVKLEGESKVKLGAASTLEVAGTTEIDFTKLVLVDSGTGLRYKINFRNADKNADEGDGVVMTFERVMDAKSLEPGEEITNLRNRLNRIRG